MRLLKFVLSITVLVCVATLSHAAEKAAPAATSEKPADQTGSITGTIQAPDKDTPAGAIASLHQPGANKGEETIYFLFAEGSVAKQLKELANKNATATVSGTITKDGYKVTSIAGMGKQKK